MRSGERSCFGLDGEAATLAEEIDAELDREQQAFAAALERGAPATTTLALATTIAHNLGDLSRVVDAWPQAARASELHARYSRLGHADGARHRRDFLLAGTLNKELMAIENHRFLALRKPRALRRSRALLLPVGPWFDAWGEALCRSELLEDADRAEVVAALIELHLRSPAQEGCLRALAAIHRETRGGLGWYGAALPARLRKEIGRGRIREAIDVSRRALRSAYRGPLPRARALRRALTGACSACARRNGCRHVRSAAKKTGRPLKGPARSFESRARRDDLGFDLLADDRGAFGERLELHLRQPCARAASCRSPCSA